MYWDRENICTERDCAVENRITKSFVICTLHQIYTYKSNASTGQRVQHTCRIWDITTRI